MSTTLTVTRNKALETFKGATEEQRAILKTLLGGEVFEPKITDRVKTFEDACSVVGISVDDVLVKINDASPFKGIEKQLQAQAKLLVIAQALNQGWLPDWEDEDQEKWYPWFAHRSSGFGFSYTGFGLSRSGTTVGSRLYYATDELATYAGKQFESLYNEMLSI